MIKINYKFISVIGVFISISSVWVGAYFIDKCQSSFFPSFPIGVTMAFGVVIGVFVIAFSKEIAGK